MEVRVLRVFLGIPAQRFAGKIAGDGDGLALLLTGDEQVLVGYHFGVARTEQTPDLLVVPVVQRHGHDALIFEVLAVIDPCQAAVCVQIALLEGVQIGGDVVLIGVGVADAVPVSVLDPFHQRDFRVDLVLRQRLNRNRDRLFSQNRQPGSILAGLRAVRTVEDLHRQGDGLRRLAGQRTVDPNTRAVRRGRRFDHAGIAAGDDHRRVLAVDLEVARGRELNVVAGGVNTVFLCQLFAGDEILQAGGRKCIVQLLLIKCRAVGSICVALYRDLEHLIEHDGLFVTGHVICALEGEACGQDRLTVDCRPRDHSAVGNDAGVAARPHDLRPLLALHRCRQVQISLGQLGQRDTVKDFLGHNATDLVHIPVNRDGDRHILLRLTAAGEREIRFVGVEPLCALIDRFVGVVIEVGDTADGRDRRRRLNCCGDGRLCRDKFHTDTGKACVRQPCLHHRLHVAVLAEPGVKGSHIFQLGSRFIQRVFICAACRPNIDGKRPICSRIGVCKRAFCRQFNRLFTAFRQSELYGVISDRNILTAPLDIDRFAVLGVHGGQRQHGFFRNVGRKRNVLRDDISLAVFGRADILLMVCM